MAKLLQTVEYEEPQSMGFTRWKNPTEKPVTLKIRRGPSAVVNGRRMPGVVRYVIKPGEEVDIPSEFDRGIQLMHEDGKTIMAGLAPQLVNLSAPERQLHSALDPHSTSKREVEEARKAAEERERVAGERQAIAEANARATEAERKAMEAEERAASERKKLDAEKAKRKQVEADEAKEKAEADAKAKEAEGAGGGAGDDSGGKGKATGKGGKAS